jgi:diguanylate cyclase (GGDEF)-like protein
MKRLIPAFAIILGWASAAWAAPPATLTTLRAIHALSDAEARRMLPVAFEATVTYYGNMMFVQDNDLALFVLAPSDANLLLGDRVLVRGKTLGSFRPIVWSNSITVLRHGALPKPIPTTFDELINVKHDCMFVSLSGVVRTANVRLDRKSVSLQLLTDGGYIDAIVNSHNAEALESLLDAEVEITGVVVGEFDGKMQMHGVFLAVSSPAYIKILKRAAAVPWSLPITPMDQVIAGIHVTDRTRRVRVHGTVTYYQPNQVVVLQDGAKSLWVATTTVSRNIRVGDVVDAIGFPESHNGFLALTHGEIQDSYVQAPIQPLSITRKELVMGKNATDLVSVEGQVVMEARSASQDEYGLMADGQMFKAIYRHPPEGTSLPPMKQIPLGSKIRASGICILEDSNPFSGAVPFDILMRSFDDITVVGNPSPLNVRNLMILIGLLLVVVVIIGARVWLLERNVHRQSAASAALERRRSRILEDINGSRPLAEVVEEIAEMVSFMLKGAPCWCQIADGARLGNYPRDAEKLRIVREEIPARSGPPLGVIFAAFDPQTPPLPSENEKLFVGTRLATLAVETRKLYSDLLRRSEFDLLTDIHNRFSLEQHLDTQIEEARQQAGIFGLVYIDLDGFKQVNDLYGHRIGDLYLQEVALRMKRQLRPHDTLARLGGDEFAVLLPMVRNRAGVEEIALRLERCFDEPLALEGYILQGAASFGFALYPENGATKDDLLNAADAAMYEVKNAKKQIAQMLDAQQDSDLTPKNL